MRQVSLTRWAPGLGSETLQRQTEKVSWVLHEGTSRRLEGIQRLRPRAENMTKGMVGAGLGGVSVFQDSDFLPPFLLWAWQDPEPGQRFPKFLGWVVSGIWVSLGEHQGALTHCPIWASGLGGERRGDGEAQQQGVLQGVPRDLPWPCSILLTGGVRLPFWSGYSLRPELAGLAACLVGIGYSSRTILPPA